MLSAGRRRGIVDYVERSGDVTVESLSEAFEVSPATIRRDLTQLDRQGLIERAHGGAAPKSHGRLPGMPEPPILQRSTMQVSEKRAIGRAAAFYVDDGDVIVVSGGTTTAQMIPYIADRRNLTVITNHLNIASLLAAHPDITTVILGGTLRHTEMSMLGILTEDALRNLRADKLFMGTPAVDPEYGFSADDMTEVQSDRNIMAIVCEVTILADHTKFGRTATLRQAPITGVRRVVTDAAAPQPAVEAIRDQGVEVDVAEPG